MPCPMARRLAPHLIALADSRALPSAGNSMLINRAMIPMTTRSSTRVNAVRTRNGRMFRGTIMLLPTRTPEAAVIANQKRRYDFGLKLCWRNDEELVRRAFGRESHQRQVERGRFRSHEGRGEIQ